MDKLLIVDGMNLLFRMFYGMPSRIIGANGKPIQGALGFTGALLKILKMTEPSHAIVIFDSENCGERRLIDPDYKADRPDLSLLPVEETPFSQLDDVYRAIELIGIAKTEAVGCEADDMIASHAVFYSKYAPVVIVSDDSDFFQLISDRITVMRYNSDRSRVYTPDTVREIYGIFPSLYAQHKALTGDGSDNIKGVYGVGPKYAASLLNEFGDIHALLSRSEEIRRPSLRRAVSESKERILNNLRLIELSGDSAEVFEMSRLKYVDSGMKTGDIMRALGLL